MELSPFTIAIGLLLIIGLGLAFYFVGALILGRMREARENAETEKTFIGGKTAEGEREAPTTANALQPGISGDKDEAKSPL
jgi:hypothetical protein